MIVTLLALYVIVDIAVRLVRAIRLEKRSRDMLEVKRRILADLRKIGKAGLVLLLALGACGDNLDPAPDALTFPEPLLCHEWAARTEPAPDVGEVRVPRYPFYTPSVSYRAADGASTWSYWSRRWEGRVGTYGESVVGGKFCTWLDAIETRTPATGEP